MARTPSKITKRDIDKDLYLEIVSEASNETNIQKLLDDYVRKDEGIAEWQIPTKYRQDLTKRLNDIDADVQTMKNSTTQKDWNDKIEKRLKVVEQKEGVTEDDPVTSETIGTQVAANMTNISKNTKQLAILKGQIDTLESTHASDKMTLEDADTKLQQDFDTKLEAATTRMTKLETSLAKKRNITDVVTYNDLDDHIKKDMHAVLNIGDSTLSALDNMDSFVQKVENVDSRLQKNQVDIQNALSDIRTTKSLMEQSVSGQIETIRSTEKEDVANLQTTIDKNTKDLQDADSGMKEQISALQVKSNKNEEKIRQVNDKVENVALTAQNNAINVASCLDNVDSLKESFQLQKENTKTKLDDLKASVESSKMRKDIPVGRLMYVSDSKGTVSGKNIVTPAFIFYSDQELLELVKDSKTPIYDPSSDMMLSLKTAEDLEKEAEDPEYKPQIEVPDASTVDKGDYYAQALQIIAKKYWIDYAAMTTPEYRNTFIFDMWRQHLLYYVNENGAIQSFGTQAGVADPRDLKIPAGSHLEFSRHDANKRQGVTVLLKDSDEKNPTKDKWINSEGVITVAYEDMSYLVYNNSGSEQEIRIIEG